MSQACQNSPKLGVSDWNTIKDADWNNGGWTVGSNQTWICRDPRGDGSWVLRTTAQGFDTVTKCTMSEDDFGLIAGYDMDPDTHMIDADGQWYCITYDANNNTAVPEVD